MRRFSSWKTKKLTLAKIIVHNYTFYTCWMALCLCLSVSAVCCISMWPWTALALRWAHRENFPTEAGADGGRHVCSVQPQITLRWWLSAADRYSWRKIYLQASLLYRAVGFCLLMYSGFFLSFSFSMPLVKASNCVILIQNCFLITLVNLEQACHS